MGSRVMHYCISSLLPDRLAVENRDAFLLGGIAPDVHAFMGVKKDHTHFIERDVDGKGYINYRRFCEKYKFFLNDPFYQGYLCHLISDHLWSTDTYFKIVEFMSIGERTETLQISYRDFWRLNGRLIQAYQLNLCQHVMPTLLIEEIDAPAVQTLVEWMHKDFAFNERIMNERLELFHNDNSQIFDYVHKSVDASIAFLADACKMGQINSTH